VLLFRPGGGGEVQGPRDMDVSLPQETTVVAGRTATVDFHLGGGVLVHGKVVQAGQPVADASIGFSPEGQPFGGHASVVSGEDGSYQVEGLEPGRYVVRVDRTPLRVELPDVQDFELNLEIPTGAVAGRVLDARSGAPVADARVLVLHADAQNPAEPAGPPWSSTAYAGSGRTATDGTFEVTGLAEGAYELQISHPDYSPGKVAAAVPAGGRRDGIEVRLEPGARLAGQVVDAQGAAVAEAMVLVADPATGQPVRADMRGRITGMDGRFEISGLAPGRYAVRAIAPGYAASPEQMAEAAVGAEPVVLRLTNGGRLEITVVDSAGQPVAGVRVQVLDPVTGRAALPGMPFGFSGEPPATDDAGRLTFEHVTPGAWVLAVPAAGGPGTRSPVDVREGETTTATLVAG
jgi:protocatechuate 3,4-dioxygenase beta subunit